MPRPPTGSIEIHTLADGSRAFRLRFRAARDRHRIVLHEAPGCACGCGGGWDERAARNELGNILARVRAGVWERPEPLQQHTQGEENDQIPTFEAYVRWWLRGKIDGLLGERPISESTASDYRWRLNCHLLPFFGHYRLDQIDRELCLAFKEHKLREAAELREAIEVGADLKDRLGRRTRPLGPASLRKLFDGLGAILDEAVEDGHLDHNPARSRRMRVRVPKPKRTFLEMDELACLLAAAAEQDVEVPAGSPSAEVGATAAMVAGLVSKGLRPAQIAAELGITKSTVSYHLRKLGARVGAGLRRAPGGLRDLEQERGQGERAL